MRRILDCSGAPRDLGLDEGRELAETLRSELQLARQQLQRLRPSGGLRPLPNGPRAVAEAVLRHFPHLAERSAGLTKGVGVARSRIWPLLARELRFHEDCQGSSAGLALGLGAARTGAGPVLAKALDLPAGRESSLLLRRSTPDNDHRSLELSVAGLPAALAGVNQEGLAVLLTSSEHDLTTPQRCAAPPLLFVQDCLQRFTCVENALEWCMTRPVGGRGTLLLADADGELAGIEIDGETRRSLAPSAAGLICAGRPEALPAAERALAEREIWDEEGFLSLLASHSEGSDGLCRHGGVLETLGALWIDPAQRRLSWLPGRPCARDLVVEQLQVPHPPEPTSQQCTDAPSSFV